MSLEDLRLKLQNLINVKAKCESQLTGETKVAAAEVELKSLEPIIISKIKELQILQVEKEKQEGIASGRGGIENCKIILKELETQIPDLEKQVKEARVE